ncbi:MAG: sulfotransferase [Pseudomonas sp.]|uniref:sulfotransferase family protein n=1 Tax=Pseudomonas sp. TaxID=306 RepID=UPI0033986D8A
MLNFICIGAQKSGTSWLHATLSRHPSIAFPGGKEVHYWDAQLAQGEDWYKAQFPDDRRCNGDITPAYAILPRDVIRRIHAHFPSLPLIFLIRNPMERAWSAARMAVLRAEMRYPEASDQWFIDHFRSAGSRLRGDYARCLEHWFSFYPRERFLIARYEEVFREPVAFANQVLAHIGLDAFFTEADRDALAKPVFEGPGYALRPALREVLLTLYADRIDALGRLLGEDFSAWKQVQP